MTAISENQESKPSAEMMRLADAIMAIGKRDHVTFADLREIPGFKGDYGIEITTNCLLWSGLSEDAVAAIEHLRLHRRMHPIPASPLAYLIDGCTLAQPIARKLRAYKRPHWMPTVLRPGPAPMRRASAAERDGEIEEPRKQQITSCREHPTWLRSKP